MKIHLSYAFFLHFCSRTMEHIYLRKNAFFAHFFSGQTSLFAETVGYISLSTFYKVIDQYTCSLCCL